MSEGDDKLLRRYRELSRDEPPAAIDAAILAASRRAVASRPWSRRFAAPVSIAAVLMLAVGVTLNVQREEPGIETAVPEKPIPAAPASVADAAGAAAPSAPAATTSNSVTAPAAKDPAAADSFKADGLAREAKPAKAPKVYADKKLKKEVEERPASVAPQVPRPEPRAFATAPAPEAPPVAPALAARAPAKALQDQARAPERGAAAQPSASREKREDANVSLGKTRDDVTLPDPAAELERIARLRADGRHEQADTALEAFVRKNPDYRIPEAVWERVRRR